MNRKEAIRHDLCPQWLKDAEWEGNVELLSAWPYVIWKYGVWEGGLKSIGQCYWRIYYSKTHIKIGCKTKTVEAWKEWFAGDDVYKHKRDSEQFKKIKQAYLMAVAVIEIEKGEGE